MTTSAQFLINFADRTFGTDTKGLLIRYIYGILVLPILFCCIIFDMIKDED